MQPVPGRQSPVPAHEGTGFRLVGWSDLGGRGDGMQVLREGDWLYVAHFGITGAATSVLDVSDPAHPRLVLQSDAPPGTHCHKVQVGGGLLLVNEEQFRSTTGHRSGLAVYSLAQPAAPERIGYWDCGGKGVHRIVYTGGRWAHMSATPEGEADRIWVLVDLEDPEHPVEAARWKLEEPAPPGKRYAAHHALVENDRAYLGYGDAGMVVLDVSDITRPRMLGRLGWEPGGDTHTCLPLPGRGIVAVTDEAVTDRCAGGRKFVRLVDVRDAARPRVVSKCPEPAGNYCERGLRFGPHNLHENRPASYRSASLIFVTYFNAGLRVYDVEDPERPAEVASFEPAPPGGQEAIQSNDLFVAEDLTVYLTDRIGGGLYILEPDAGLRQLMESRALPA